MRIKASPVLKRLVVLFLPLVVIISSLGSYVQAIEPVTTITLIIFAGKVYAIGSRVTNGLTAAGNMVMAKLTAEESEKVIEDFLETIDGRIEVAGQESRYANTPEDSRQALNKQASLEFVKTQYEGLLQEVKLNKNLTVTNIAKKEIKDQGAGFILGEMGVPDEVQGSGVSGWTFEQAIKIGGYEVTKRGSDFLGASVSLFKGVWQAGDNIIHNRIFGDVPLTEEDLTEEDKAFYQALKEGRVSPIKVAITKAQWDYFIKVTAKEEFKKYLRGETSHFNELPFSIQEKYWNITWLLSDQVDEIHEIMKAAREGGDYAGAVKQLLEKYPKYVDLFKSLAKGTTGDIGKFMDAINKALEKEAEIQKEAIEKAKKEAEEEKKKATPAPTQVPEPTVAPVGEDLPTTVEEVIDEAKQLSPYQTKSSCRAYFDRMCRGLCGNEPQYFDMCYNSCFSTNSGACGSLSD